MNELKTFAFNSTPVRIVEIDGNPWFVARDVLEPLGYSHTNASYYTRSLPEGEKAVRTLHTPGGQQNTTIISESGLYKLILRAQTVRPAVVAFQNWVTQVVLPAIRKDGGYILGEEKVVSGEMDEDTLILRALEVMKRKVERLQAEKEEAETKVIELEPKADIAARRLDHFAAVGRH